MTPPQSVPADGTAPGAPLAVHLQVGLQVEALDVFAVVAPRRQRDPLVRDGTLERYLRGKAGDALDIGG